MNIWGGSITAIALHSFGIGRGICILPCGRVGVTRPLSETKSELWIFSHSSNLDFPYTFFNVPSVLAMTTAEAASPTMLGMTRPIFRIRSMPASSPMASMGR